MTEIRTRSKLIRYTKVLFIMLAFLIVNLLIDAIVGGLLPAVIVFGKKNHTINFQNTMPYILVTSQLVKAFFLWLYIRKRNKTFLNKNRRPYILIRPLGIGGFIKGVSIGIGTIGFGLILINIILALFKNHPLVISATDLLEQSFLTTNPFESLLVVIAVVVGAPIVEELTFRGVLFEELNKEISAKATIFWTAFIFGLFHFNILQSPNTFFMGLVLAYTYYKSANILLPIIIHFTNNFFASFFPIIDLGLTIEGLGLNLLMIGIGLITLSLYRKDDRNVFYFGNE